MESVLSATMSSPNSASHETKVIYYVDDELTPYVIEIPVSPEMVTLADLKNALNRPNCKFFFPAMDCDIGVVKEEVSDDTAKLPTAAGGRLVSWLVTGAGTISTHSKVSVESKSVMDNVMVSVDGNMDSKISIQDHVESDSDNYAGSSIFDEAGGAVSLDGRIEVGDMLLQVNHISFENLSNDQAVEVLKAAVKGQRAIKLIVAKSHHLVPKECRFAPLQDEPVRPIDPSAWVAHTEAVRQNLNLNHYPESDMLPPDPELKVSKSTMTSSTNSGSQTTAVQKSEEEQLNPATDIKFIVKMMAGPKSGLDIRDRTWLKMTIPNAFLGSDVVDWLRGHVTGLSCRKNARKFAAKMLKEKHIKHPILQKKFSEQRYYTFNLGPVEETTCTTIIGI